MDSSRSSITIDVDIGGTFTDCFVHHEGDVATGKAETTEHELSRGFMTAVERAAADLGLDRSEILAAVDTVRYSTTVALNNLIEREGTTLGLLVREGFEDTIYIGRGSQWADGLRLDERRNVARAEKPEPLVPEHMTVGVRERIDADGEVVQPLDEEHLREQVRYLVDEGARAFVVSLLWSFRNPVHERRVREIIEEEFPDSYLGSAPVFLSSEVAKKRGEYERTMTTVLNAYLHRSMIDELYGVSDELREDGYRNPLMMIHNTGGSAEMFRTTAIDTFNSGPVAAMIGSRHLGDRYGFDDVITADMGGTSFDLSLVQLESSRSYDLEPVVDRWRVHTPMLETKSIGAGGGSIASINEDLDDRIEVGPESAGANPGPACYNQGGREPTVTDADVVLGYINPDNFHDGEKRLSERQAERAIERRIARPLGVDVVEAASLVRRITDANMGNTIYKEAALRGQDPRESVLFAIGGAGPTHAEGFARHADVDTVVTFPYASVFSAYGSSVMDTMHVYEYSENLALIHPETLDPLDEHGRFNDVVERLREEAFRDLRGEGYEPGEVSLDLELDAKYGGQLDILRVPSPHLFVDDDDDVRDIRETFEQQYRDAYSPISMMPETGVEVENFVLKATVPREPGSLPTYPGEGRSPSAAHRGQREVYWNDVEAFRPTDVYEEGSLAPENVVEGPAIVEGANTTIAIPPGATYRLDEHRIGTMRLA